MDGAGTRPRLRGTEFLSACAQGSRPLVAIGERGQAGGLFETKGKVKLVFESDLARDFADGELRAGEELAGLIEATAFPIAAWRHSDLRFEKMGETGNGKPHTGGEFGAGNGSILKIVEEIDGLANTGINGMGVALGEDFVAPEDDFLERVHGQGFRDS